MRSVVDLAGHLGLRAVAEGIETPQQQEAVLEAGCEAAQGFLIGRPMPADALLAWAGHRRGAAPARLRAVG